MASTTASLQQIFRDRCATERGWRDTTDPHTAGSHVVSHHLITVGDQPVHFVFIKALPRPQCDLQDSCMAILPSGNIEHFATVSEFTDFLANLNTHVIPYAELHSDNSTPEHRSPPRRTDDPADYGFGNHPSPTLARADSTSPAPLQREGTLIFPMDLTPP